MNRKILLGCGAISSALYVVTDIVAARRYEGYSYADQWFSELTAEGSPTRKLLIAINGIPYTALIASFAAGVFKSAGENRPQRITAALLGGYAAAGALGGIAFPMHMRQNEASLRNVMHIPSTMIMSLCVVLAMGFGTRVLGARFRTYSYATIAVVVAFGALTSTQAGRIADNKPTPWAGAEERVNIAATMLWIAVLSIGLMRAHGLIGLRKVRRPSERALPVQGAHG
jgi:hypothetical protein